MFLIATMIILFVIIIKYKPTYKVIISGEEIGYIDNKEAFEEKVKTTILETNEKQANIDSIAYKKEPEFKLELVDRSQEEETQAVYEAVADNIEVTYKYYEIAVQEESVEIVDTFEEAKNLVEEIKDNEKDNEKVDLSIIEKYTVNSEEIKTNNVEIAKENITNKVVEEKEVIEEQERIDSMPTINGIKIAYVPVTGVISSRYGVSSSIRKSTHTGLDIACSTGTPIKVVASGVVTAASYSGSYGNLVKVDHGNGLETWYAHASKINVSVGQKVEAGEIIATVGSTGNSTGAHLHLEFRINGSTVDPQNYLYN